MLCKIKNEEERVVLKQLAVSQSEVTHVGFEEKLDERHFHYHTPDLFEPLTKKVKDTSQNLHKESSATTKAFDDVFESLNTVRNEKELKDERNPDSNSSTTFT